MRSVGAWFRGSVGAIVPWWGTRVAHRYGVRAGLRPWSARSGGQGGAHAAEFAPLQRGRAATWRRRAG